jgi:ABC-2 type transport system permease protein
MTRTISRILAAAGKEMRLTMSYRLSFVMSLVSALMGATIFFFLSRLIQGSAGGILQRYGGSYFAFVIIGIAFQSYLNLSMDSLGSSLRSEQLLGTLEAVAVTPTPLTVFAGGTALWQFLFATYRVVVYILFGVLLFGLRLGGANFLSAVLIMVLSILAFSGIGAVSGSFILVYKQGNPIRWLYGGAATLLGGVYYPLSMLPDWLRPLSVLFPITHSLEGMRMALLAGAGPSEVLTQLLVLLGFALVSLPVGALCFRWALRKVRRDGTLSGY